MADLRAFIMIIIPHATHNSNVKAIINNDKLTTMGNAVELISASDVFVKRMQNDALMAAKVSQFFFLQFYNGFELPNSCV